MMPIKYSSEMRRRDSTHENTSKHRVKRSIWFRSTYPAILQQYCWMQFGVGCFDSKKIKAVQIKHLSAWDMISQENGEEGNLAWPGNTNSNLVALIRTPLNYPVKLTAG